MAKYIFLFSGVINAIMILLIFTMKNDNAKNMKRIEQDKILIINKEYDMMYMQKMIA